MINPLTDPRAAKLAPNPNAAPAAAGITLQRTGGVAQLKMPTGMIPGAPAPITQAAAPQAAETNALPSALAHPGATANAALAGNGAPQLAMPRGMIPGLPGKITPTSTAAAAAPPTVGGGPGGINPLAPLPAITRPGTASPDVNPQSPGTRFGSALRSAGMGLQNRLTDGANRALGTAAAVQNTLSYPSRAAAGFGLDTLRAAAGATPRPNAGSPITGIEAPTIKRPYQPQAVNFATGGEATGPGAVIRPTGPATPPGMLPAMPAAIRADPNYTPAADNISAGNLAAALRMPTTASPAAPAAALKAPGIDSGVDIGGRHLNYGAMVDGVPTFSDGTSGIKDVPGTIPRTMSDETIAGLGGRLQTITRPTGALASDALGHTPTTGEMVAQNVARGQLTRPITGSRPSATQFAASDRASIANRDPRSISGTAAHNLAMEAQYGNTRAIRRAAAAELAGFAAATDQAGLEAQKQEGDQAITDAQGRNQLDNTALQGRNMLANTALDNRGRLLASQSKPTKTPKAMADVDQGVYAKYLADMTKQLLGTSDGMIVDPEAPGGYRAPTPSDIREAQQKAKIMTDEAFSRGPTEGQIYQDKNGARARYVNGQYVPVS